LVLELERQPLPALEVEGPGHIVTYVNAAFCALKRQDRTHLVGRALASLVPAGSDWVEVLDRAYQAVSAAPPGGPDRDHPEPFYARWPSQDPGGHAVGVIIHLARRPVHPAGEGQNVTAVNEALLLAGLRLQASAESAANLNTQLEGEIGIRKRVERTLLETQGALVAELSELARLHQLSTSLWRSEDLTQGMQEVLDAAVSLLEADLGTVQLLHSGSELLEVVAQHGLNPALVGTRRQVSADAAAGRAVETRRTQLIEGEDLGGASWAHGEVAGGMVFRAVRALPLVARAGPVLGVLSLHFRQAHLASEQEMRRVDLYVRQASDFVEGRQARAAVAASEARLRFMAEAMPQKIFTASPGGELDYFNRQWMEFTGLASEHIRDWTRFVHPEDVENNVRQWQASVASGKPFLLEHRFRRADGVYRWHLSRAVPMRDAEGATLMWIGSSTDIHDQKQVIEKLAAKDRDKDEFLAMLAHELRNPLAPIKNAAQVLRMLDSKNAVVIRAQEIIERQADHLTRLVDELLDVSRIQKGKVRLHRQQVDLAGAAARAAESVEPLIHAQQQVLTLDVDNAEPLLVDADPTRIEQILVNLIRNAVKFTAPAGSIHVSARAEDGMAAVRVRDTGVGLAPEMLERIFDVFTQVDQSLERTAGGLGLGLGLNVVKELVELHGGTVEATSAGLGRGSEFIVRLPKSQSTAPTAAAPDALPLTDGAQRILVVDDSPDNLDSMELALNSLGHSVVLAEDGGRAVELALQMRPDVAFVDIGLPTLNGYEVARRIRKQPGAADMLLVALSGYGQPDDKRKALAAGFDAHLTKPADLDDIAALLKQRGASRQLGKGPQSAPGLQ